MMSFPTNRVDNEFSSLFKNLFLSTKFKKWAALCWSPMEKEMATHSRILVWKIPWAEERGVAKTGTQFSESARRQFPDIEIEFCWSFKL